MSEENVKKSSALQKVLLGIRIFLLAILGVLVIFCLILTIQSFLPADKMPGVFCPSIAEKSSMEPTINRGDFLLLHSAGDIKEGDVVSYKAGNGFVLARVTGINNGVITVKGDAEDDAFAAKITAESIRGVWGGFKIPKFGYFLAWLQTAHGCVTFIAAIILIDLAVSAIIFKISLKHGNEEPYAGVGLFGSLLLALIVRLCRSIKDGKSEKGGDR